MSPVHRVMIPYPDLAPDVARPGTYPGTLALSCSLFSRDPSPSSHLLFSSHLGCLVLQHHSLKSLSQCPQLKGISLVWSSGHFCYKHSTAWGNGHSDPRPTFAFSTDYLNCLSPCFLICKMVLRLLSCGYLGNKESAFLKQWCVPPV